MIKTHLDSDIRDARLEPSMEMIIPQFMFQNEIWLLDTPERVRKKGNVVVAADSPSLYSTK